MDRDHVTAPSWRVASLFTGVGGFDLGLERSGFATVLQCEIEPGAVRVLHRRFDVELHEDVQQLEPQRLANTDLLTAGFPCQDLSQVGRTAGIEGKDSSLVGEVFRLLEKQPVPWVLFENVPFMLNLNRGRAVEYLVSALERLGYRWAYRIIDTRAFGLPHRRRRVFILASLEGDPAPRLLSQSANIQLPSEHRARPCGFYWTEGNRGLGWVVDGIPTLKGGSGVSIPSPPAIWLPEGPIVSPSLEAAEALQGFPPGWTQAAEKVTTPRHRWKLLGNAVTVDVAAWLGDRIRGSGGPLAALPVPLAQGSRWPNAAFGNREGGRFRVDASPFPVAKPLMSIRGFLTHGTTPLSLRATAGFYKRLSASRLSYPKEFGRALERHIERLQSGDDSNPEKRTALEA